MPVLAEEAIGGAAGVKHSQVVVADLSVAFANPIGDAVGGQRIAVPVEQATGRGSGEVNEPSIFSQPQSAEAAFAVAETALIAAQ